MGLKVFLPISLLLLVWGAWFYQNKLGSEARLSGGNVTYLRQVLGDFFDDRNPEFLEDRSAATPAHLLWFHIDRETHEYRLYFVDCPRPQIPELLALEGGAYTGFDPILRDQQRYFGGLPVEKLLEVGQEAQAFVHEQLRTREFRLVTRWERVGESLASDVQYYCYLLFRNEDGGESYLSEMLVERGYARPAAQGHSTPFLEPEKDYREYLRGLAEEARQARRGAWAYAG
ncbi:MAG: hypothetical protein AAF555_08360 [Verrucomicrobiota bacterium]